MAIIKQLAPHVADLIAAGEVVERPASVVKELMENAIDAGANAVTVEIAHGGMSLIRVTDDGCGIPADQAATAFLRHATSKIATEYDLEAIGTLGFRGEALAAISAVSRVELLTRIEDADLGVSLTVEAGVVTSQEEAGCPRGTTLSVRELFYNTPARLKFMKKDAAEGAAVFAVVQRVALSHPELSVKFIRDGKQELLTPGDGQLKSAVYAVMGRDIALGFLPVKGSGEGMSAEGFASLPTCCRGSRSYQHFFVNGRYVKSRIMMAAVEEAYKNQKMVGKFPGCVIHLTVRPGEVDVNVHPTKTEVKFQREQQVFSTVYYAVLSALDRDHTRPQAVLPGVKAQDTVTPNQASLPLNDGAKGLVGTQFMPASRFRPVPGFEANAKPTQTVPSAPKAAEQKPAPAPAPERKKSPFQWVEPLPDREPAPAKKTQEFVHTQQGTETLAPKQGHEPVHTGPEPSAPILERTAERPAAPAQPPAQEPVPEPAPAPKPEPEPIPEEEPWVIRGELFRTYVMVEQGDKVLLIDKHAAHERANFDRLKAADYQPMVQELLTPVTFSPAPEELEILLEQSELLARFGFEVEEFGGGALAVRSAPDYLDAGDIEPALAELARRLRVTGTADPAGARDELLHTMACKAAIKGGWRSGAEELEEVARMVMSGAVKYCPHGRPVAIEMTKKQLEKQFKRA
ncbi:MAG: DNA mismatch repair endonuclease MutL [Clostridiales bacterium]|nr:DNA mismatch repair endonuclease MutL [Clostridiales bacterium]